MSDYEQLQSLNGIVQELSNLTLQLIDMNQSFSTLLSYQVALRTYSQGIVDELRTLNSAVGRIEDIYAEERK